MLLFTLFAPTKFVVANTTDVINWFSKISQKDNCSFIQLDIKEFYPSITKTIFDDALNFAKTHTTIGRDEIRTIKHCQKSLLFSVNWNFM